MDSRVFTTVGLAAYLGLSTFTAAIRADYINDFNSIAPATDLATVSGWSKTSGSGTAWQIDSASGRTGNGIDTNGSGNGYTLTLDSSQTRTAGQGATLFKMNIMLAVTGTDRSQAFDIRVGEYTQFVVRDYMDIQFISGTNNNNTATDLSADNLIQLSSGGTAAATTYTTYDSTKGANWAPGVWYTLELTFTPTTTGTANNVVGSLTVYKTDDPSATLVNGVSVTAVGSTTHAFDAVNQVVLYDSMTAHQTYIDNLSVTAVPEPAAAGLLGLGMLMPLMRQRKSRTTDKNRP